MYGVQVDGLNYEFSKWGAEEQVDVLLDVAAIVGKPLGIALGAIMGGDGKLSLEHQIRPDLIALAFEALTERMDKKIVKVLLRKFASENVLCEGKKFNYDQHYQDRLDHLFKVTRAGMEVQYGNFLGALLALLAPRQATGSKAHKT